MLSQKELPIRIIPKYPTLRAGMLVEYASGNRRLIVPLEDGHLVAFGFQGTWDSQPAQAFGKGSYSIVKVGYPEFYCIGFEEVPEFGKVIWEQNQSTLVAEISLSFDKCIVSYEDIK